MFNDISHRYDFLNHFLSMGIDRRWRSRLVRMLSAYHPERVLDVACGTGDLALAVASLKPQQINGIDISGKMLEIGRQKIARAGLEKMILLKQADAEKIPFSDNSFDAVTVAFGVRNFEDLRKGLAEMSRVLRPSGVMLILEFSHPETFPMKQLYGFYSRYFIPLAGRLISGNRQAYTYLPESVAAFPSGNRFLEVLSQVGLKNTRQVRLSGGIATVYLAEK
jgi:demethylmenaquinone methyltransferase/2-methoxy-6-polyprenyl-1,4-benzoquinol methylase